jgi:hypothetical protein
VIALSVLAASTCFLVCLEVFLDFGFFGGSLVSPFDFSVGGQALSPVELKEKIKQSDVKIKTQSFMDGFSAEL